MPDNDVGHRDAVKTLVSATLIGQWHRWCLGHLDESTDLRGEFFVPYGI